MEKRLFEDLIASPRATRGARRSKTVPVSLVLHLMAAALIIVVPLFVGGQLPEPEGGVKAFFAEPLTAPAPPPPPPPPAARSTITPRVQPKPVPQESKFVAPIDIPREIRPEDTLDLGVQGGVVGGVEGGVPGGVVGGVVGGLPDVPPPPPQRPVRVGGQIKEPKKLNSVSPVYPAVARQARVQGVIILECIISPQGRVTEVKVLRGVPLLDEAAIDAVKQWVYTPTLLNGVPVPVIMTVTVNFKLS
jgi:protein TonB